MCRAKRLVNSFGAFSLENGKYLKTSKVEDVLQNCFQSVLSLRLLNVTHFRYGLYKIQQERETQPQQNCQLTREAAWLLLKNHKYSVSIEKNFTTTAGSERNEKSVIDSNCGKVWDCDSVWCLNKLSISHKIGFWRISLLFLLGFLG